MKIPSLFAGVVLLGLGMVFDACHKHDAVSEDEVTIEITSPREGQSFRTGEEVPIRAKITGSGLLHGWAIEIRRSSDGKVLFAEDAHEHKKSFTLEKRWKNTLTERSDLTLEVFAQIDHGGKKTSKTLSFNVSP